MMSTNSATVRILSTALLLVLLACPAAAAGVLVRVGLVFDAWSVRVSCNAGIVVRTTDGGGDPLGDVVSARPTDDGIELNGTVYRAQAVTLHPANGADPLTINGKSYRGDMVVVRSSSGRLTAVNYVDIDSYIMGVLAGEVPSTWPEESLKAQAVAARSYALDRLGDQRQGDWDVVATDRDQVYEGVRGEVPSILRAVEATRGEVLTWQGDIVKAYFHASCGGHTEDVAVAFGETNAPFLRGVRDPYCGQSPYQAWGRDVTISELRSILERSGQSIGPVIKVEARRKNQSGRVEVLEITHSGGKAILPGVDLRRLIGYRDLRSTAFDIKITRTIPVNFISTKDEFKDIQRTEVFTVPEEVEIGMEETSPVNRTVKPEDSFYVITGGGGLERSRAGYAYAASSEGVLRTFAMRPGLVSLGLDRQVVVTSFTIQRRKERVTKERVKQTRKQTFQRRLPVALRFVGRGWGHGVGMCQWGARGMASQGFDYRQILRHYYPGTGIEAVR